MREEVGRQIGLSARKVQVSKAIIRHRFALISRYSRFGSRYVGLASPTVSCADVSVTEPTPESASSARTERPAAVAPSAIRSVSEHSLWLNGAGGWAQLTRRPEYRLACTVPAIQLSQRRFERRFGSLQLPRTVRIRRPPPALRTRSARWTTLVAALSSCHSFRAISTPGCSCLLTALADFTTGDCGGADTRPTSESVIAATQAVY